VVFNFFAEFHRRFLLCSEYRTAVALFLAVEFADSRQNHRHFSKKMARQGGQRHKTLHTT